MHRFDYRFLKESIPAQTAGLSDILYDLRAKDLLRRAEHPDTFAALREAAIIESVRSSNAIEGVITTEERMEEIVRQDASPLTRNEYEILGYKNALREIYENDEDLPAGLSEDYVCHFHALLFESVSPEAGKYKTENNFIQERAPDGRISVRFIPTPAKETNEAMEQWVLAYHEARQEQEISALFLTACVIVDFLCIHPFTDGNGRVSRLLTTLLLQRAGFDISRYISLERLIDQHKAGYYDAIYHASQGWHKNKNDYTPFILYMMQILYAAYKELDRRFIENSVTRVPKNQLVTELLLNTYVPVSKAELSQALPEVSITTIERVLGFLVKEGKIEKIGTYKDARYRKK